MQNDHILTSSRALGRNVWRHALIIQALEQINIMFVVPIGVKFLHLKRDSFTLKVYKPLWNLPQKSDMAAKEGYVGQNGQNSINKVKTNVLSAITHFYDV